MKWNASSHSANITDEYLFHQLLPYIGNKRKLLGLIEEAMIFADISPNTHHFVDLFAGTGVVSRMAKQKEYGVTSNDWEYYSEAINKCYIETNEAPIFQNGKSYKEIIDYLNNLKPREDWITNHLCPDDDDNFDITKDRLFYMRKNGMRIDAIRHQIEQWDLTPIQKASLLAPLLYQCCYNANTSGVFKGFHNGWGGQTKTALHRIKADLILRPALFIKSEHKCTVTRMDAQKLADNLSEYTNGKEGFVYLDPPYNQHPYGSNYHVLNSVTLWDKPKITKKIEGRGSKSAIRKDWREERRSSYNYKKEAVNAYKKLINTLNANWIATSYSTDGMINLEDMIKINKDRGNVKIFTKAYKRYRVSSQRYSNKAMNIEFIILTNTKEKSSKSVEELTQYILKQEQDVLKQES